MERYHLFYGASGYDGECTYHSARPHVVREERDDEKVWTGLYRFDSY
jgi:hypothetical protein